MSTRHSWQKKLIERGKANRRKRDGVKSLFAVDGYKIEIDRPTLMIGRQRKTYGSAVRKPYA